MIVATVGPALGPVKRRRPQPRRRRPCAYADGSSCAGPVARVAVMLDRAMRYRAGYLPLCLAHRERIREKLV